MITYQKTAILLAGTMLAALTACGSNTAQTQSSSQAQQSTVSTAAQESQSTAQAESTATAQSTQASQTTGDQTLTGVVIDAAMHSMTLQTADGNTLNLSMAEDGIDNSGLKDGILLGQGVTLTYTGTLNGTDTSDVTVTAAADLATKADDSDALMAAGSVIMAMENDDYDSFVSLCGFPMYVGKGDGETVTDEASFREKYPKEDLFTPELVQAVTHADLLDLEKTEAGLVLSGPDGKPNVILNQMNGNWLITGIND